MFVGWRGRATSGTTPSNSRVTMSASLCALPAASKSISGFQANTTKATSRARSDPERTGPLSVDGAGAAIPI